MLEEWWVEPWEQKRRETKEITFRPGVVAHVCNPSTLEAKAGGSPEVGSSRPA